MRKQNQQCSIDPLHGLKTVSLDFEKKQFAVNGVDIGHCTDVEILFHDGVWTVNLGEQANFTTKGDYIPKKLPAVSAEPEATEVCVRLDGETIRKFTAEK